MANTTSNLTDTFIFNFHLSLAVKIPLGFVAAIISLENILVCIVVLYNKQMRTYTNGFIVSLAVSDLLVGGVLIPGYIHNPHEMNSFILGIVLISNTTNIFAVSVERYIALAWPLRHRDIIARHFVKMVLSAWMVPVVITVIPVIWGADRTLMTHKFYLGFLVVFAVIVPYMLIFIGYIYMIKKLRRRRRNLAMLGVCSRKNLHKDQRKSHDKHLRGEIRLVWMFAILASFFVLSWLPIVYMSICDILNMLHLITVNLSIVSVYTIAFGSVANPLLYSLLKDDFKKSIKEFYRGCFGKCSIGTTNAGSLATKSSGQKSANSSREDRKQS